MKPVLACAALVTVLAPGRAGNAFADDGCGINSNKPAAQQNSSAPARSDVKASSDDAAAAKATLTGVSASELKVKPKPEKTSAKEPAK